MAGNSKRRGAVRKASTKKGPTKGTGGHGRKALEGRGPTPKAEDRPYHPAHKRKVVQERRELTRQQQAAAAAKRSPIKVEEGSELIFGRNPVAEAVRAGAPIRKVFLAGGLSDDRVELVVRTATALGAPIVEVSKTDLDRASDGAVHQGLAVEVPPFEYAELPDLIEDAQAAGRAPLFIALDSVTDPHNLGAVIRSAGAFGADGVIIGTRRSAQVNATVWKVSAGAAARVPVVRVSNLARTIVECKEQGLFAVGLDGGGDVSVRGLNLATEPLLLVTGAEGAGLSRLVREHCDQIASIPISSNVESLNAAVATGVALYEVAQLRAEVTEN
ncbi:23S rRNA (guanosine(2251)-2'-O)-methyltransferase RlmB [Boudabousia liubingyangii]|uniref:23S rRNA (Guanosine(2251)-2'-O)-methyltransferase RlmB n=1 Tax=Boudabousia liubingyangii TaxID=1921764 RepID=A0A1Q5PQ11_9ACTO|nr:23S rRNA (guanosine(2251)-2'-O)-methyltransferase RlmB [Boudabousia liubingyangii]OKL48354.1 23S rRNA (guanosine(2251)-2'-O)-methyltransferase RlmB [Boudabousia liubingyangii]OKL49613.1 23S rRNA (guanosine(2251)-2'-O)-methyltransferase RlmB [Boudabousia liubingyangii]